VKKQKVGRDELMEKRFTSIDPEIGIGKVVQIRAHV
jgi:hypothetical protein